jgi:DNA-binding MarR family transcriptional regulator
VLLADMLALERVHGGSHGHEAATFTALEDADATPALEALERRGLVLRDPEGRWTLTDRGRERAARR